MSLWKTLSLRPALRLPLAGAVALALHGGAVGAVFVAGARLGVPHQPAPEAIPVALEAAIELPPAGPPAARGREAKPAPPRPARARPRIAARPRSLSGATNGAAPPPVLDLTGTVMIAGRGAAAPAAASAASAASGGGGSSRARPVGLAARDWRCPWPAQAEASDKASETVLIRVTVDGSGRATAAAVLADPGAGFGEAARRCALSTRFLPALDQGGRPVAATSPAIRVRFFR